MTQLFIWILAAYGMSQILVFGSIFDTTKRLDNKILKILSETYSDV